MGSSPNSPPPCKALPGNSGPCGQHQLLPGLTPPSVPALTTPGLRTCYFLSGTPSSLATVQTPTPSSRCSPSSPLCSFSQLPWPALLCASKYPVPTYVTTQQYGNYVCVAAPLHSASGQGLRLIRPLHSQCLAKCLAHSRATDSVNDLNRAPTVCQALCWVLGMQQQRQSPSLSSSSSSGRTQGNVC